jgi:hypothetical protein
MDESSLSVGGVILLASAGGWLTQFHRAVQRREGETFARRSLQAGMALFIVGSLLAWPDRSTELTCAETLAQLFFLGGGGLLAGLSCCGTATGQARFDVHNLTDEPVVYVNGEGHAVFTLLPEPWRQSRTLPRPQPRRYFIVSREWLQAFAGEPRQDLLQIDPGRTIRDPATGRLLVQGFLPLTL